MMHSILHSWTADLIAAICELHFFMKISFERRDRISCFRVWIVLMSSSLDICLIAALFDLWLDSKSMRSEFILFMYVE